MKKIQVILLISLVALSLFSQQKLVSSHLPDPYFSLTAKTFEGSFGVDYLNLIKNHLRRIGIILNIFVLDYSSYLAEFHIYRYFDLFYVEINETEFDPYLTSYYTENGSNNVFGYATKMDWNDELQTGRNEWYIQNGSQLYPPNSTASINLNWEWQQYLMDKILPGVPLFTKNNDSFSMLAFNMREVRSFIGNRDPCPLRPEMSIGLAIRKAIAYVINREEINEIVHGNSSTIINTPIYFQDDNWCNPDIIEYCYYLDAARYFMTIAGPSVGFPHDIGDMNTDDPCDTDNTDSIGGFTVIIALSVIVFSSIQIRKFVKKIRK